MPYRAQYCKVCAYLPEKLELTPGIHVNLWLWIGVKDSNGCSSRTLTRTAAGGVGLRSSALREGRSRATMSAVYAGGSSATRASRRSSRSPERWVSRSTPGASSETKSPSASVRRRPSRRTSTILSTAGPLGRLGRRYASARLIAELEHRSPDVVVSSDPLASSTGRPFKSGMGAWTKPTSPPPASCSSGACDQRRRATRVYPMLAFHRREEVG